MRTKNLKNYFTQDELKRLFAVIDSTRDLAIFVIAYRHGLRASEVGLLDLDDVDLVRGKIRITRLKGSLSGEYSLQRDEIRVLRAWLRERNAPGRDLFPSRVGTGISRYQLNTLIKRYGEMAGVPPEKCHFHALKHSIATHLLNAKADINFVREWLGHKNIQNTIDYQHYANPDLDHDAKRIFAMPQLVGV